MYTEKKIKTLVLSFSEVESEEQSLCPETLTGFLIRGIAESQGRGISRSSSSAGVSE